MAPSEFNRRDFNKLTSAALGGLLAGTAAGCGGTADKSATEVAQAEVHICRGLNTCKGQGGDGKNACAGQGICATAKAHSCAGENACKGQGGCGETPGANACKGMGGCHVPLDGAMWDKARKYFEEQMKKKGVAVGAAPAGKA